MHIPSATQMGGAQPGCVGDNAPPPLLGPAGTGGTGVGLMKMIFASTADSRTRLT